MSRKHCLNLARANKSISSLQLFSIPKLPEVKQLRTLNNRSKYELNTKKKHRDKPIAAMPFERQDTCDTLKGKLLEDRLPARNLVKTPPRKYGKVRKVYTSLSKTRSNMNSLNESDIELK